MDLNEPALDFIEIAHGMGMAGKRVSQPDEIESAVQEALASGAPYLLEVMTEGRIPAQ
jgi:thiamine pyrophosphate-dependent acetolactate synthase large subunit-like protein